MPKKLTKLMEAYKKERDGRIKIRLQAVCHVLEGNKSASEAAAIVFASENSVREWVKRFDEAGIDGLYDLPRSGRPTKVPVETLDCIIEHVLPKDTNPDELYEIIVETTGVSYSRSQIRKIMHKHGMSRRKRMLVHVNHASEESVYRWQTYMEKVRLPRLRNLKFKIVAVDEAFFVQGRDAGHTWGSVGKRSITGYAGDHTRVAVFGAVFGNGEQMFKTYTKSFTSEQFIECLEALRLKLGKIAVLCDRWKVHTSKEVKEYLKTHKEVRLIRMPRGSPYLNVVEQCWNNAKHALLGSAIYRSLAEMLDAVTEYFDTTSFAHLRLYKYLYRHPRDALNYL